MPSPQDFKGSRLAIGLALSNGWLTLYELASMLGKTSGAIQGVLHRMVEGGLVEADSDPPTRGTLYRLHSDAAEALREAAELTEKPGSLAEHQRLLWISGGPGRSKALALLASNPLTGSVGWVARTGSEDGLIVAMIPDSDDAMVDSLVFALEEGGFDCREGLVSQIMSAPEMRQHQRRVAKRVRDAVETIRDLG